MRENSFKWLYWFIFAAAIIIFYNVLANFMNVVTWIKTLISILMPFFMGLLLAYVFYMPVQKTETLLRKIPFLRKRGARLLSVLIVYIIAVALLVVLFQVVLPSVFSSIKELAANLPNYYNNITDYINELPEDFIISKEAVVDSIEKVKQIDIIQYIDADLVFNYIKGAIGVAQSIFNVFVTIIMSIYILLGRKQIVEFLKKLTSALCNRETYNAISKYFKKSNEVFFKFISSQILDGIVIGIIASVAMLIMDVKYAVLLGFMIGLFNIIPYFGAIVAVSIATIITVFTGGVTQAIWMLVIVIVLQQIDANIINPRIVGDSLKLSPILIIFAVTFGGAYFGVLGMFLGVPVIAVIKTILCDYIDYRIGRKKTCLEVKDTMMNQR
ncbi:MAG: AI-2E family transporter [Lachnospiraceae bacterium]|nr:AI-2E family transporter [Lachnospiraceae bacterium]